ncbi:hypothetical protein [Coleofasciculus sp. FACHB-129]|uniref:hypothetical protein n=1 Tax=Cyanophyceae TaxID=3028117 RepID=UPI0016830E55|nr:hypothetical protein [Coleofasciculus sp. FACHB-129]MBD1894740.1 hypothetical protein [Coleofasciculus sp. FACHB-129]
MPDAQTPKKTEEGIVKRPNYFAGQYLLEDDFKSEQNYHIDRQRRHNRLLNVSGIAEGLTVSKHQDLTVKVSARTAFDSQGRQIILLDEKAVDLVQEANNNNTIEDGDYTFSIRYSEELTDLQGDEKFTNTRVQEKPVFVLSSSSSTPDDTIALAKLTIKEKNVTEIAPDVRQYSGIYLPAEDGKGVTLRARGVEFPNEAILEGSLKITERLVIGGKGYFHDVHIVGPFQLGNVHNIKPVIRVNNIVNEISEGTQDNADKALPTVKAAVDYADTKAKKNGDSNENFTAAQLTATQLTINNGVTLRSRDGETPDKALLDGSLKITGGLVIENKGYFHDVHIVGPLQLGNVENKEPVIRVNNIVNEISEGTQDNADKALPSESSGRLCGHKSKEKW